MPGKRQREVGTWLLTTMNRQDEGHVWQFKDVCVCVCVLQITEWFGELTDQSEPHPETEHPGVFRISNDPAHGYLGTGLQPLENSLLRRNWTWYQLLSFRTGAGNETWHIDGSFLEKPHSHSLYHIIKCPSRGSTGECPKFPSCGRLTTSVQGRPPHPVERERRRGTRHLSWNQSLDHPPFCLLGCHRLHLSEGD